MRDHERAMSDEPQRPSPEIPAERPQEIPAFAPIPDIERPPEDVPARPPTKGKDR